MHCMSCEPAVKGMVLWNRLRCHHSSNMISSASVMVPSWCEYGMKTVPVWRGDGLIIAAYGVCDTMMIRIWCEYGVIMVGSGAIIV